MAMALAAMAFALCPKAAYAAPEQVTLSVPTTVPCAVLADGTVVAPDNWEIRSEVDSTAHLAAASVSRAPDRVSFSAATGGETLLSYSQGTTSIGAAAVPARGSANVSWIFGKLDAARCADVLKGAAAAPVELCAVSMTFTAEPVAFAVYSADDGSLDFYKRAVIPEVGSTFEGKAASKVYTGFETAKYSRTGYDAGYDASSDDRWKHALYDTPWFNEKDSILSISVIDDGIAPLSLENWFYRLDKATSADISKLDVSKVESAECLFIACSSMTSIQMPAFTPRTSIMKDLVSACPNLVSLDLSSSDLSGVSSFFHFARLDASLAYVSFPKGKKIAPKNMELMFGECENLKSLDLADFDTSNASAMGDIFHGCVRLERVALSGSWRWSGHASLPAPSSAFIVKATGKWYDEATGEEYEPASLPSNKAATYVAYDPKTAFAVFSAEDGSLDFYNRTSAVLPVEGDDFEGKAATEVYTGFETREYSCTQGGSQYGNPYEEDAVIDTPWYARRLDITEVEVVDSGIRPKSMAYWFMNFQSCVSFELSKLDVSGCTSLLRTFNKCKSVESLDLSSWNTRSLVKLREAFLDCRELRTLDISSWNTAKVDDIHSTFNNCHALETLNLGTGWTTSNIVCMGWTFDHCRKLGSIPGIEAWDTSSATDMQATFGDCPLLVADLSSWNVSKVTANTASRPAPLASHCQRRGRLRPLPFQAKPRPSQRLPAKSRIRTARKRRARRRRKGTRKKRLPVRENSGQAPIEPFVAPSVGQGEG